MVTLNSAALWTDSRYYIQAEEQLDCNWELMKEGEKGTPTIEEWIGDQLQDEESISSDPKIATYNEWSRWNKTLGTSLAIFL